MPRPRGFGTQSAGNLWDDFFIFYYKRQLSQNGVRSNLPKLLRAGGAHTDTTRCVFVVPSQLRDLIYSQHNTSGSAY